MLTYLLDPGPLLNITVDQWPASFTSWRLEQLSSSSAWAGWLLQPISSRGVSCTCARARQLGAVAVLLFLPIPLPLCCTAAASVWLSAYGKLHWGQATGSCVHAPTFPAPSPPKHTPTFQLWHGHRCKLPSRAPCCLVPAREQIKPSGSTNWIQCLYVVNPCYRYVKWTKPTISIDSHICIYNDFQQAIPYW